MKAMILAAGRGTRLRPLTEHCPKPLLAVKGKPLISYHLEKLSAMGIQEIVINVHHLWEKMMAALGEGEHWGVRLRYSVEETLLETGGGICRALSWLGSDPFILVNGDIWTDFDFSQLPKKMDVLGHLVLVDNPAEHPQGDYTLTADGKVGLAVGEQDKTYTYSGIAVLDPALFADCAVGSVFRLPAVLERARTMNRLGGQYYGGRWTDVGNVERLIALEERLR